jgi:4-diphosphocytidyl-2-C-methyl-D-erythritol kinase
VPNRLTEPAPAKVNLYLHLTGRRDDGYHLLDSLVVFAGIGDTLTAAPAETLSLHVAGPFAAGLAGEPDNLVLRAARALAAEAGVTVGAHLVLDKHQVATAEVFRARHGPWSEPAALPAGWDAVAAMAADLGGLRNDLEPVAIALRPVIGDVLAELAATPGCLLARMSGSGATCFGLYRDAVIAGAALGQLQKLGRWCWAGSLRSG